MSDKLYLDVSTQNNRVLIIQERLTKNCFRGKGDCMEQLSERKMKILQAIVANYLETGEPVGSRTISKYTDLNLSSATIRNEMADLEESGYIEQPHTSAGRIPTDAGYRVYVDQLMMERDTEVAEMRQEREGLLERVDRMEVMLKQVAKVLAYNTNYAAMITAPQNRQIRVKFLQLTMVDDRHILAVIVVDGNVIKNQLIEVEEPLGNDEILKLSILMNSFLQGASLSDINIEMIQTMKVQAGIYADVLDRALNGVVEAVREADERQIYTSGATNILKYPEIGDAEKTSVLLDAFEEKKMLNKLADETLSNDEKGIQIYIGDETPVQNMKDLSVVTATYELQEGAKGTIGIIGPKRMDYKKVVSTLKELTVELDEIFNKKKT